MIEFRANDTLRQEESVMAPQPPPPPPANLSMQNSSMVRGNYKDDIDGLVQAQKEAVLYLPTSNQTPETDTLIAKLGEVRPPPPINLPNIDALPDMKAGIKYKVL